MGRLKHIRYKLGVVGCLEIGMVIGSVAFQSLLVIAVLSLRSYGGYMKVLKWLESGVVLR